MAKDPQPLAEFAEKAKESVDQTKEQIQRAVDTYFDVLQKAISAYPSGGTELGEKLKNYAEKDIAATHQFIQKLGRAKSFLDITRIQTEFVQTQVNALAEQAKNIGTAYVKTAEDAITTKMPFNPSS